MADGHGRASRVVGSADYVRPVDIPEKDVDVCIVEGVFCEMPFIIKYWDPKVTFTGQQVKDIALEVFSIAENCFSRYKSDSELSRFNLLPANTEFEMSEPFQEVVYASSELYRATRGVFDPAFGSLLSYFDKIKESDRHDLHPTSTDSRDTAIAKKTLGQWRYYTTINEEKKRNDEVADLQQYSTWKSLCICKNTIKKLHASTTVNFDGIAKGWAIDKIISKLQSSLNLKNALVDWAGDIRVAGVAPGDKPWSVMVYEPPSLKDLFESVEKVELPRSSNTVKLGSVENEKLQCLAVFQLHDGQAISTSGDYAQVQFYRKSICSHIFSKKHNAPNPITDESIASAVVIGTSAMSTDAFATAAMASEDVGTARRMLDPLRTSFHEPISDFLIYSRAGPRIVRMTVPGEQTDEQRKIRRQSQLPARVIVVGGGLAGLSAAISAADAGAFVTLIEKEPRTGGNSAKATSGINGYGTSTQAMLREPDDERLFERDTFRSGKGGVTLESLVRILVTKSASAIHWLKQDCGIPLSVLSQLGGHSAKRTHRAPPDENGNPVPIGYLIVSTLRRIIDSQYLGRIDILNNAHVQKLIHEVEQETGIKTVKGVEFLKDGKVEKILNDAVILATGGFSNDMHGLMAKYRPDLRELPTTNGKFAMGEGVKMAEELGASLMDMDKVQLHPTGFIDPKDPFNHTKFLAPEMIRGSGGILVNSDGKRFIDELNLRSVVSAAIQKDGSPYDGTGPNFAWCILAKPAQDLFGIPTLNFYKNKLGLFDACETLEDCAKLIGCSFDALKETVDAYSQAAETGICSLTNKIVFPSMVTSADTGFVVARVTPSIHYTMGGVEINGAAEVQELITNSVLGHHRKIRRLYACGEVSSGVHGANRLGGNSLLECVVFGRIAGENAAGIHVKDSVALHEREWTPLELREMKNTDLIYGKNTREIRFNFHGSLQTSGLAVGQYISIRGELDGETLIGYFSPITRPNDEGLISILCRFDEKGGPIFKLLSELRPGNVVWMQAVGGLKLSFTPEGIFHDGRRIRKLGLLAGGTGIAPMMQIVREYLRFAQKHETETLGVNLLYAAEEESDLAFLESFNKLAKDHSRDFRFYPMLNKPPLGWTEGVGFVMPKHIKSHFFYPPKDDQFIVICGPPVFERIMTQMLTSDLRFARDQIYSYSQND